MLAVALHAAFDRAIGANSWVAGDSALSGFDPLLRMLVRRKLKRAIERADRATITDLPAHRLRLAALIALGKRAELDADDVPGVEAAYAALGAVRAPKRGAWFSLGIVLGVGAVVSAVIFGVKLLRPFDPNDTPQGELIGKCVTDFVVAAADQQPEALNSARRVFENDAVVTALGVEPAKKLRAVLQNAERLAALRSATPDALDALNVATVQLNHALFGAKLPYFVDSEALVRPDRLIPLLMTSYIERERVFEAAGKKIRSVHLWRLDTLRVRFRFLGYTRPHTPAAIVLLDQSESELVRTVLPALAPKENAHLVDDETRLRGDAWALEVETEVGNALRRYVAPNPALTHVATLVARRRALIKSWRERLSGQGFHFVEPERLIPEHDYVNDLAIRVPRSELREWESLHEALLEPQTLNAFIAIRDERTALTERHEVQHRIEYSRDLVPVPEILCKRLGLQNPLDAPNGSLAERSKTELAAYLAQVASGKPAYAAVEIALLAGHLLNKYNVGGPYSYAALAVLELIARELAIDVEAIIGTGIITPQRSARLVRALLARSPVELQAAAKRAYEKSFGQPVPEVRLVEERANPSWRH